MSLFRKAHARSLRAPVRYSPTFTPRKRTTKRKTAGSKVPITTHKRKSTKAKAVWLPAVSATTCKAKRPVVVNKFKTNRVTRSQGCAGPCAKGL
ncbi:hypothetical protein LTR29_013170 [Friedmanniomyces endolithicus]|nr:hypothetical protein LTR29_013170 [Friedmanniomyces endolithicus]KAK1814007.1 hypothetical protein LTR12_011606 [Friedmanniomyces endolithicus]